MDTPAANKDPEDPSEATRHVDDAIVLAVQIETELHESRAKRRASFSAEFAEACRAKMRKLAADRVAAGAAAGGAAAGGAAAGGAAAGGAAAGGAAAGGDAAEDAADSASSEGSPFGWFHGHGGALDSGVDSEESDDDGRF